MVPDDPYWKDDDERAVPETLSAGGEGCPKCGHDEAETGGVAVTSDGLARYANYQNQEFVAVSCAHCGYTEFYRRQGDEDLVDLFFG